MKTEELISIIVPIYNVEQFLDECIKSILEQTYKNLEVILCDDGSTDSCPQICDKYAKIDPRIHVVHKDNGGLSDARNAGIDIATGDYITFIDSDDFINKNMISYLYNSLKENDADMACCQRQEVDIKSLPIQKKRRFKTFILDGNKECMKSFFCNSQMDTVAWGKLYKYSMFKNVRYPVGKYNEDVFTTYKIVAQCKKIFVGKRQYYNYRIRPSSIMTSIFTEKHLDAIKGNVERAKFGKRILSRLRKICKCWNNICWSINVSGKYQNL